VETSSKQVGVAEGYDPSRFKWGWMSALAAVFDGHER
jgi:hypothetical protein